MSTCYACRGDSRTGITLTLGHARLARIDLPICAGCYAELRLATLLATRCNEPNADAHRDTGLELACRRTKGHKPPHRDGLWFWSTGPAETRGGWDTITEADVQEAMR